MAAHSLPPIAQSYLHTLCLETPNRRVGSQGNRQATDFCAAKMASFDFQVETPSFTCLDWIQEGAQLQVAGSEFEVFPSPYSLPVQAQAPLMAASSLEELESAEIANRILLLRGDLAKEPLMPKNFPFYNPVEHNHIIQLLERGQPIGILTATSQNPQMAGAVYPFPMIEDGDFDIPSAYMTAEVGDRLAQFSGREASLTIRARRIPAQGNNVIARRGGEPTRRIVLCAHIDAKDGSPGAIDNASGSVTLLLLGELLAGYSGKLGIEIVFMNGEDYYANPGEMDYLRSNSGRFEEISLGINLDGLGYVRGKTAYSLYGCPTELAGLIRDTFSTHPDLVEGEPWYQGDHFLFLMNQRPALALTSQRVAELMTEIVHTSKDKPEVVEPSRLAQAAQALHDLVRQIEKAGS
jgi:aminopeptidase YwaD